jgi:hypothetical protein
MMIYQILRYIQILTVLLAAYSALLFVIVVPFAWLVPMLIAIRILSKKTPRLWSHGTASFANASHMKGMIDE